MKNLWQYKHWPDEKNPDEIEPWPADQPPNPCTVFRVKWLEQIRTWARYVSGEFVENLLTVQPPQPPDPITTDTVVQKASFWDFLTFSGEWPKKWIRFADIPDATGVWNPTAVELPEWEKFHVGDVLHPGATEPNDVLMDRLVAFREYIEPIKAIEIEALNNYDGHFASLVNYTNGWYSMDSAGGGPHYDYYAMAFGSYIFCSYWATIDTTWVEPESAIWAAWVVKLLFQRAYRVALLSGPADVPSWSGYHYPTGYIGYPKDALYCHGVFGLLPTGASGAWQDVGNVGAPESLEPRLEMGDASRPLRYFLLIDDDLPPALVPPGAPILSPG